MSPTESHRFRWGALLVGCIVVTRIGGRTPIWSSRPAHATTVGLLAHISVHGGSLRTARMSHAAQPRPNGRTRVFRHYDAPNQPDSGDDPPNPNPYCEICTSGRQTLADSGRNESIRL